MMVGLSSAKMDTASYSTYACQWIRILGGGGEFMKMGWVFVGWGHALSVIIGISRTCLIYNFPCTITIHTMSINWAKVGGGPGPLPPPIPTACAGADPPEILKGGGPQGGTCPETTYARGKKITVLCLTTSTFSS